MKQGLKHFSSKNVTNFNIPSKLNVSLDLISFLLSTETETLELLCE